MRPARQRPIIAGFGRSDITPRTGVGLAGFGPYLNRNASAVHSPLMARALVIEEKSQSVLLLSLEVCALSDDLDAALRARIQRETGLPEASLFISSTHTHSGPQTAGHIGWGHPDDLYLETLPGRVLAAVTSALANRTPVTISYACPPCEGIGINRERDAAYDRSSTVEALLLPSWRPPRPDLTDTTCRMVIFKSASGLQGVLHNFGCHPVVCCEASTRIHGDFVGLASRAFESAHPGSCALFLPGALGDLNPSVSHRTEEESMRALSIISQRYFNVLEDGLRGSCPLPETTLQNRVRDVVLPRVNWDASLIEEKIRVLEHRLHAPGITDLPLAENVPPLEQRGMDMVRLAGLRHLQERLSEGKSLHPRSRLHALSLGPVRFLGAPLELYNETRLALEKARHDGPLILVSLANGAHGYAPDPIGFKENPYAAEFVNLMSGHLPFTCLHEFLLRELVQLARNDRCPDT